MKYCSDCGNKLFLKELKNEGLINFCDKCNKYVFELYSVAVSMIVLNKKGDKTLLIKQYGKDRFILVAGYINKTESAEEACQRELFEEVGLKASKLLFNKSEFHHKSNTLMLNYIVYVEDEKVVTNDEIDYYEWFSLEEAKNQIASGSLAEKFYLRYIEGSKNEI